MITLSLFETRVIGVLLEKERTTPDQYPLSLNSLTTACNQKSSREPVLALDEQQVQEVVDGLIDKRVVTQVVVGNRVPKYKHRFCNTEFSELQLSGKEVAVLCVLFLRGAQTPGELRTRGSRLYEFTNVQEVEVVLQELAERREGPFVVKYEREAGKRECRYAHLFSEEAQQSEEELQYLALQPESPLVTTDQGSRPSSAASKVVNVDVKALEARVATLESQVAELMVQWKDLNE